jgi:hypothetical protein
MKRQRHNVDLCFNDKIAHSRPKESVMKRPFVAIAALVVLAAPPLLAADTLPWPWKSKMPIDPALVVLSKVNEVTASVDNAVVTISVKAEAQTPQYSELQLTPRRGDPNDRIFAFDARGRAPQEILPDKIDPVSIDAAYSGAPIGKFDVIEVYAKENCMGYSVKDGKPVACASKPEAE